MRIVVVALLVVCVLGCGGNEDVTPPAAVPGVDTVANAPVEPAILDELDPIVVPTAPQVDENLFVLRLLSAYYDNPPEVGAEPERVRAWLTDLRGRIETTRRSIRRRKLDKDIDLLYEDSLLILDAYAAYLDKVREAEEKGGHRNFAQVGTELLDSVQDGGDVAEVGNRALGALVKSVGEGDNLVKIFTDIVKSQHAVNERALEIEKQRRELAGTWTAVNRRAETISKRLTEKHHWIGGESGNDGFNGSLLEQIRRRPRDPFAKIAYAKARRENETADDVMRDAELCLEAAELVPADPIYNTLRYSFVEIGAELALYAASLEAGDLAYTKRARHGARALAFARGYLAMNRKDARGVGHDLLARSLAFRGRYSEAVAAAMTARDRAYEHWGNDPYFCYRYATMLSLEAKHVDWVAGWLDQALERGLTEVHLIRRSPTLANFRRFDPVEYKRLTTPKLSHHIQGNTIYARNDSEFTMTDLRVDFTISNGDDTVQRTMSCDSVGIGAGCGPVHVPEDGYDQVTMTFACDQCEEW